jgi:protein ImuB
MLWLDLYCPRLALDIALPAVRAEPVAVVEAAGAHEVLVTCNDVALRAGVRPGMGTDAARVRAPGLRTLKRNPTAEEAALERLGGACFYFTDYVSLQPPTDVLLEIGGSRRLFGGLDALLAEVGTMLGTLGREAWQGIAPTPTAARLLAHRGGGRVERREALAEALGSLPCRGPGIDERASERLEGWGVSTLGGCFALPREGVSRRLGRDFLDYLDRLRGQRGESPARFQPPGRFEAVVSLPEETASLELPILAVERLLAELEVWLRARDAGIQDFRIDLYPRRGDALGVEVGLATPAREARHMQALARERLERTVLHGPVVAVGVRTRDPVAYHPPVTDLLTDTGSEPPERLLERLRARLGPEAVHGLALAADHRPERAWQRAAPGGTPDREPVDVPPRPLWLLAQPGVLPLDEQRRPLCQGQLDLLDGPERIETGWWDGDDVERDYFVARNPGGSLLWIYRERRVPVMWYLHGLFG